jgi:hypothetical protein
LFNFTSMSAKVSSKVVLSEKFEKEVLKFFKWVENIYTVKFRDIDEKKWTFNLVKKFEEPARNKLVMYIKAIMDNHSIVDQDDVKIDDAKLMANDFKENGNKKETKKETKKDLLIDVTLDTSGTWYLCDISADTETLEAYFGCKAGKTGDDGDDHQYEWKFEMDDNVYSVYDWCYTDGSFDKYSCTSWYLGGNNNQVKSINKIKKELDTLVEKDLFEEKEEDSEEDIEIDIDAIIGEDSQDENNQDSQDEDEIDWD